MDEEVKEKQDTAPHAVEVHFDWIPLGELDEVSRLVLEHDYGERGMSLPTVFLIQTTRKRPPTVTKNTEQSSSWTPSGDIDVDFRESLTLSLEKQIERLQQIVIYYQQHIITLSGKLRQYSSIVSQYKQAEREGKLHPPPEGWPRPLAKVPTIDSLIKTSETLYYFIDYNPHIQHVSVYAVYPDDIISRTVHFSETIIDDLRQEIAAIEYTIKNIHTVIEILESLPRIKIKKMAATAAELTIELNGHIQRKKELENRDPNDIPIVVPKKRPHETIEAFADRFHQLIIDHHRALIAAEEQKIIDIQHQLRTLTHNLEQAGEALSSS